MTVNSTVYNSRGQIIDYCPAFSPELKILDLDLETGGRNREPVSVPGDSGIDVIYQAITYGISKFMSSIGINKVIIGLSGGIDSAVTACLYTLTLGPENVLLVNMPSIFNSETTRSLSARLAENLGCLYTVMPIQDSVDYTAAQISQTPVVDLKSGREFKIPSLPLFLKYSGPGSFSPDFSRPGRCLWRSLHLQFQQKRDDRRLFDPVR